MPTEQGCNTVPGEHSSLLSVTVRRLWQEPMPYSGSLTSELFGLGIHADHRELLAGDPHTAARP